MYALILVIADRPEPNRLTLRRRGNGCIGKGAIRCCGVPMFNSSGALDHIPFTNDPRWLALLLVIANAFGDEQNLSSGMNVPIQPGARIVGRLSDTWIKGTVADYQLIQPDVSGMVLGGGELSQRKD